MTIEKKLLGTNPIGGDAANVADVFSTHVYTGTGAYNHHIDNGIDLYGEGGLVWIKNRGSSINHCLFDSARGSGGTEDRRLFTNSTSGDVTGACDWSGFKGSGLGFLLNGNGSSDRVNQSGQDYVSWAFRKAPKFFTCLTYTGSGSARSIAHDLGAAPAFIMVKRTSSSAGWAIYHKDNGSAKYMLMDTGAALTETTDYTAAGDHWNGTTPSDTTFSLGGHYEVNYLNNEYVAYLFADNSAEDLDDQMIKCGSVTGNSSATQDINLGWEAQYVLYKSTSASHGGWYIWDSMRGFLGGANNGDGHPIYTNQSSAEFNNDDAGLLPTGFQVADSFNTNGQTYIYMAIRAPMMVEPESATEVFAVSLNESDPDTVFPVDFTISSKTTSQPNYVFTRLTGIGKYIETDTSDAEASTGLTSGYDKLGIGLINWYGAAGTNVVNWMFKRAKGFFDVVAYSGNSVAGHEISHSLGVEPEMIWAKCRSSGGSSYYWQVYHSAVGDTHTMRLNENQKPKPLSMFNNITTTSFRLDNWANTNESGETYIAYLFATLAGVSKVGSYTGNGSSQTLDCGFASGARFVLIKRTDATGDWYIWDTARGIVAGNDPHLSLNTTAAEVTTVDSIDPHNSGFIVNQDSVGVTDLNQTNQTYVFYAIA